MIPLRKNQILSVSIDGYNSEGLGVARANGQVLFVHGAVKGELCDVRILKVLKNTAFARVEKILQPSPARQSPDCPSFPACGGCNFRHVSYEEELEAKRQRVEDALRRIAHVDVPVTILGCSQTCHYRNKSQFPLSPDGRVGFYRARSHQVVPAAGCLLQSPQANAIALAVESYLHDFRVPAYNEASLRGLLRHVCVRTNHKGQALACLVVNGPSLPHEPELIQRILTACPQTSGIVLNSNSRDTNVILGSSYRTLWGSNFITDSLCGLLFQISIPSFFQVNRTQTEILYREVLRLAALSGNETVLDLYCGIGTISLALAKHAAHVFGAEIVPEAIENAKANAALNHVENASFILGDTGNTIRQLARNPLHPDVVVVDPPRKGLADRVADSIAGLNPVKIVYVSCDPGTLARDIAHFNSLGFSPLSAVAVDLFPRTRHVETVCLLSKLHAKHHFKML